MSDPEDKAPFEFEPYDHAEPPATNAMPDEADLAADASTEQGQGEWTSEDELHDEFLAEPIPVIDDPRDGIARPIDMPGGHGPPFTIQTVVCIEDEREYVELFQEELLKRGGYGLVATGAKATRVQYDDDGQERTRERFAPDRVVRRWGFSFVETPTGLLPVRPRRERCQHYRRMVFASKTITDPKQFGHRHYYRNCTVRRSLGGAYMSLQNEGIYACDFRSPPDPRSVERHLDGPDRERIAKRLHLKLSPAMGMPGDDIEITEAEAGYDLFDDFREEKGIFR